MPEILSTLSTAISLAVRLREISKNIEDAEFKNLLADLSLELATLKIEMADIQIKSLEKNNEIESLKEKLKNKEKNIGFLGARYYVNESGEPTGSPFCPVCWAKSHDLYPLIRWNQNQTTNKCGVCENTIEGRQSPLDVDHYIKTQREASASLKTEYVLKVLP